jgi:hypothetical protein
MRADSSIERTAENRLSSGFPNKFDASDRGCVICEGSETESRRHAPKFYLSVIAARGNVMTIGGKVKGVHAIQVTLLLQHVCL